MSTLQTTVDVLNWDQARKLVTCHAPKLAEIIDDLSPSNDYVFLKVRYPYGSEIKRFNTLQLPDKQGQLHTIDHPAIQSLFQKTLHLNPGYVPLGLVTKKPLEFFIHVNGRIIPWRMLYPGDWFGVLSLLNESAKNLLETFSWGLTAGARSTFLLPKLNNSSNLQRLMNQFNINLSAPSKYQQQWELFRRLYHNIENDNPWYAEVLLFSGDWKKHINDPSWVRFKNYFYEIEHKQNKHWRGSFVWPLLHSAIQEQGGFTVSSYIHTLIKHIFDIGNGALPGCQTAQDDSHLPASTIQHLFNEIYDIKQRPIIVHPAYFSIDNPIPTYYSLKHETTLEYTKPQSKYLTAIGHVGEIQRIFNHYKTIIGKLYSDYESTPLVKLVNHAVVDFCHSGAKEKHKLRDIDWLAEQDEFCLSDELGGEKVFPERAGFFNGCVRIGST